MGPLSDWQINQRLTRIDGTRMEIDPFSESSKKSDPKAISYGLTSFGYDMRLADEFLVFSNAVQEALVVDPKTIQRDYMIKWSGASCIVPPNSFVLGRSLEWFRIPRDVIALCIGKSTYARCGIIVNITPLEPEWEGHVTIEISNTTPLPARVYANEGISQVVFLGGELPKVSYADSRGKYQGQTGITLPR